MFFKNRKHSSATNILQTHNDSLKEETKRHGEILTSISEKLDDDWERKINQEVSTIIGLNRGRVALTAVISTLKEEPPVKGPASHLQRYQISSLHLKDWHKDLISDPHGFERLKLVYGTVTEDGIIVLSRIETVKLESQSPAYVQANKEDSHKKIVSFSEDYGHMLLGMFHSHTAKGAAATSPSSIDIKNLERKDAIGIDCLGGIFSLDGYVRFFSLKEFEIDIYGKGVEPVESKSTYKVFKIIDSGAIK